MRKRTLVGILILVAAAVIVVIVSSLPKATPTTDLNMTGGDPSFGESNQTMIDFNKSINHSITVLDPELVTNYDDMSKVDLVQGGSLSATDELKRRDDYGTTFKIYGEYVMSTSPNMLWAKDNVNSPEFKALVAAGFFVPVDNYFTITREKLTILVQAELNDQTYREIGVNSDKKVRIGFPNSGGGRTSVAQLLSCAYNDCEMISPADYQNDARYKQALYTLYVNGGKQPAATYSVEFCKQWLNSMNRPDTLAIFPESCYGAWKLGLSDSQLSNAEARGNVGIYILDTVVQQFTLIATSEKGLAYIELIKSREYADLFATALAQSTGMRGSGLSSIAPTNLAAFISEFEPYNPMIFPFDELTALIKADLKSYGN